MNSRQPLWMPQGSVRAILALLIGVPIAIVVLRSNVTFTSDQVIGLASMVFPAYFILKAANAKGSGE